MPDLQWAGTTYPLDTSGFLADPARWDSGFAEGMARRLGMGDGLTVLQWRAVLFVHKAFATRWEIPRLHETCHACRISLARLRALFPQGYQRGVCRLAGVPYEAIANSHFALTYETRPTRAEGPPTTASGFLVDPRSWSHDFAREAARQGGTDALTDAHWQVVEYLRTTYDATGQLPCVIRPCRSARLGLDAWEALFPDGLRRGAARVAGLPVIAR
jgi:tRNA 2-thiouridine synthesizing protein E